MSKIFFCTLCWLLWTSAYTLAQTYPQWGDLTAGPYTVGYQVINRYDYGRHFRPKLDFEGKANTEQSALPIQISMWYPTAASKAPKMPFAEYLYIDAQKNTFQTLSNTEKSEVGNDIRFLAKFGLELDLSDAQIRGILQSPTAALRNAPKLKGTFPAIIAGVDGGPGTHNVLCEYLASLGYVVLLTPSVAHTGTWQAKQPQLALAERVGNLEYLLAFLRTQPFIDHQRVGALGSNFDGMSTLLFQMKNMQADAVASLDGWEGKAGSQEALFQSPFFDANKMRVPYLTFLQDEKNPPPYLQLSQRVTDTLRYAERHYYVLRGMNHACLIGNVGIVPNLPPEKQEAYRFLYTRIGQFFEAHVKKSAVAQSLLQKTAINLGYSAGMLKVELDKKALAPVPTPEEFEKLIMDGQVEKALQIFKTGKAENPHLILFDFQTLNLFAFRFGQQKKMETVLAIWQLGAEAFPNSVWTMDRLGDAYQNVENKEKAKETYKKAIELLEREKNLDIERQQLKERVTEKLRKLGS